VKVVGYLSQSDILAIKSPESYEISSLARFPTDEISPPPNIQYTIAVKNSLSSL